MRIRLVVVRVLAQREIMQLGPRSNTSVKQLADLRNILAGPDKTEVKRALVAARFCKQERDRMQPSVLEEVCARVHIPCMRE